jgi:hypothetical protein
MPQVPRSQELLYDGQSLRAGIPDYAMPEGLLLQQILTHCNPDSVAHNQVSFED